MAFARLFQSGSIGSLTVRNRIVMAPMATNLASSMGETTDRLIAYYAARARGGAGLIVVENATIEHRRGTSGAVQLRLDADRYVPGLYALTEAIRAEGAAAAVQINHAGAIARIEQGEEPIAPSAIPWTEGKRVPRALAIGEIEELIDLYARGAVRARRAGFDAVEIHGAHGYLIAQFLSPRMNRRQDGRGGSPEARWRFTLEVVGAVREAVGRDYPLLFRISGDEYLEDGRTIDETREFAPALVEAGIDAIHVTAGTSANPERQLEPMSYPEAWRIELASAVKEAVDVPVIGVGVIRSPETAQRILAEEKSDFVAIGRGLIADPQWPNKAARGETKRIRRCISCNRCVRHRVFEDLPIRCSVNPIVGREAECTRRVARSKRVVVVGGGPAGLTAARTAVERGHRVTLMEAESALGGRLRLAAVPPHKEKVAWLIEDLISSLPEKIDIRLGAKGTSRALAGLTPDVVLLATGATPGCLAVPGASLPHVCSADAALDEPQDIHGPVAVIGGGMVGCEVASFCAERGCSVTLIELLDEIASDCEPITRGALLRRLSEQDVHILSGTTVLEITTSEVSVERNDRSEQVPAETVICAVGSLPVHEPQEEMVTAACPVIRIGDARSARGIYEAVYEGWRAAVQVAVDETQVEGR